MQWYRLETAQLRTLYAAFMRPHLQYFLRVDSEKLEQVQQQVSKAVRVLEHLPCEDRLRDLGFVLETKQLGEVVGREG